MNNKHIIAYLAAALGSVVGYLLINSGLHGVAFGLTDNGVLLIGAYLGFDIGDRLGEGKGRLGAVLGACIGNTISDGLGAVLDPGMRAALVGIVCGCLLPILLVRLCEAFITRKSN